MPEKRKAGELKAEVLGLSLEDGITARELADKLGIDILKACIIISRYRNQGLLIPLGYSRDGSKAYEVSEKGRLRFHNLVTKKGIKVPVRR